MEFVSYFRYTLYLFECAFSLDVMDTIGTIFSTSRTVSKLSANRLFSALRKSGKYLDWLHAIAPVGCGSYIYLK